ncbi:uncharacterized protein LOC132561904 [Ylistrum balloti]|uniref:uncharacterized protein LOC132561904 n=1 Tax=Ylistrum balloti TaxID=509963 RepID=UPI002905CEFB|nr:uncharacterized protein LOC132561904 [Ylistrum balloti]
MRVNFHRKLVFPGIVQTTRRPDIVMSSQHSKLVIVIELTVPWEEGCEEAHERKKTKFDELMAKCRQRGRTVWLFPVEVGCRGFRAQSLWRMLQTLGITGRTRSAVIRRLAEAAEKACAGYDTDEISRYGSQRGQSVVWPPLLAHQPEDVVV